MDIPVLAQRFLARYCAAQGLPLDSKNFSREALDLFLAITGPATSASSKAPSPRAALSAPGRTIRATDVEFLHTTTAAPQPSGDRLPSLAEAERAHIIRVLEAVQWNKKEAARVLDISRGTLYRKIVEYQLEPEARNADRPGASGRSEPRRFELVDPVGVVPAGQPRPEQRHTRRTSTNARPSIHHAS